MRNPLGLSVLPGSACLLMFFLTGCDLGHPPEEVGDAVTVDEVIGACQEGEGPLAGTCLADLGGSCWFPEGDCSVAARDNGAELRWASGHVVAFERDANAVTQLSISGRDGLHNLCFSGKSVLQANGSGRVQFFHVEDGQTKDLAGTLTAGAGGTAFLACDSGSFALGPVEATAFEQCLYGRSGGRCDFDAAQELFLASTAESEGSCAGASDCLPGAKCCPVEGGTAYCAPVCL